MRSLAKFAAVPLLAAIAACSGGEADSVVDASLERDLRMASTAPLTLPPAGGELDLELETAPPTIETPAPKPRRAPTGNRTVRSSQPTVTAAPVAQAAVGTDAESVLETITQPTEAVAEVATADSEADASDAVPLPRPTPVSIEGAGAGTGRDGRGDGDGGGWGGVVIRGGDIDDCRIEPRRGGIPVIVRRPGGGVADGRWPLGGNRPQGRTGGIDRDRGGRWPIASRGGSSSTGGGARAASGGRRWPSRG